MGTEVTTELRTCIRKLALSLLDDENGIGAKGYTALREQMLET